MFFERQSKCSKVPPVAGLFKDIHRTYFSLAGGKVSVCKKIYMFFFNTIHVKTKDQEK